MAKKYKLLLVALLLAPLLLMGQESREIDRLINMTESEIAYLQGKDRQIARVEFGLVSADSIAFSFREMYRGIGYGNEYEIIGFGSPDAMDDMDIYLFEMVGREPQLVKQNRSSTGKARLVFEPAEEKIYVLALKGFGFKSESKDAQFSLIISYTNY